jgi:hypothetical protein
LLGLLDRWFIRYQEETSETPSRRNSSNQKAGDQTETQIVQSGRRRCFAAGVTGKS